MSTSNVNSRRHCARLVAVLSVALILPLVLSLNSIQAAGPLHPVWPLDYVIIYHDSIAGQGLQDLFDLKEAEGFSFRDYRIDDGVSSDSIKAIIKHLHDSTDYVIPYVLLIGTARKDSAAFDTLTNDAIADATTENFIPNPYLFDLFYDQGGIIHRTGYDQWYTWLEPWHFVTRTPDTRIGRIPVRSDAELQAFVDKLSAYIGDVSDPPWKRRAYFLAGDEYIGPSPEHQSPVAINSVTDELAASLPLGMTSSILHNSDYTQGSEREQAFITSVNDGQGLIVALATQANAARLSHILERPGFDASVDLSNTNMYPVAIASSCNLGQFDVDIQSEESLAENLLVSPSRGLMGIIGPAGFTSDDGNYRFLHESVEQLFDKGITRLGDLCFATAATLKARQEGFSDTYNMMTVLGDPGMRIDLGSITATSHSLDATMEMTSASPYQNRPHMIGDGIVRSKSGVVKVPIWGARSFCIEGMDSTAGNPTAYWTLYDNLNITIDSASRFLTWFIKGISHSEGYETFGVDCVLDDGTLLSECGTCGPGGLVVDQYLTPLDLQYRQALLGSTHFYAFDLSNAYGRVVKKIVAGVSATSSSSSGQFKTYFDDIRVESDWGQVPELSPIQMPANVYTNSVSNVSISIDDPDIQPYGDELSTEWSVTDGSIVGSGTEVEYHAPSYAVLDVEIKARVFDKGGHVDSSLKTIGVFEHSGGGGCPHLQIESPDGYHDLGAILTSSTFSSAPQLLTDALPILSLPRSASGTLRFRIQEEGNDITTIDAVALSLVSSGEGTGRLGLTDDARIVRAVDPIEPVSCFDDKNYDQLHRVRSRDGVWFRAYGPGHLNLLYRDPNIGGLGKLSENMADGGGTGIDPPPKGVYKIAVSPVEPVPPPNTPNYISVSIRESGQWKEVARIAPRSQSGLPQFVNLQPYIGSRDYLLLQVSWTWSISIDDLSFYTFSRADIKEVTPNLSTASHSWLGLTANTLAREDGQTLTIEPSEELTLVFDIPSGIEYDLGVMRFSGKYQPFTGISRSSSSSSETGSSAELLQNSPNPFNAGTTITFRLPHSGYVDLSVYNILGQKVRNLEAREFEPGEHSCIWDARNQQAKSVSTGVYFYVLRFEDQTVSRKMVVLK